MIGVLITLSVLCLLIGICLGLVVMKSIKLYKKLNETIEREKFKDYLRKHMRANNRQGTKMCDEIPLEELDNISAAGAYNKQDEINIRL